MESIPGIWPGEVESYDGVTRTCRVRVPGITDGSNTLLEAVFNNPLGDRAADGVVKNQTEIYIKAGDPVWLMFENGDPRFPVIMGYRTPRAGNPTAWRRWHHANFETTADVQYIVEAGTKITIFVGATKVTIQEGAFDIESSNGVSITASNQVTITAPVVNINGNS